MTDTAQVGAQIGVAGLAVMGRNLARNLARHGYRVALYNRTAARTRALVEQFGDEGTFLPAEDIASFVASLERPRTVIIMVQAGAGTDAVINQLADAMEPGDIIVDGGNANFHDTRAREKALRERGLHFVGTGISGGEEGALEGPSIMPGGSAESWKTLGPMLEAISAHVDGEPCTTHIGTDGAGHFVKTIHNGIEYADMQLIGEAYDLLRRVAGLEPAAIGEVFAGWNTGELESYLIEITAEVLGQADPRGTGKPLVDVIVDQAGQKGTGRWTVQTALDLGVPVTGIAEAVFARSLSGSTAEREAVAALDLPRPDAAAVGATLGEGFVADVNAALYASKIVAYAQGFDAITAGAKAYDWDIDRGAVAKIWRGGCIIRAQFLNRIVDAYAHDPELPTLLADPFFAGAVRDAQESWRRVVATAAAAGVPVPGFASALSYFDGLRSPRLPAALVQGQRDYFGAHTYRRIDDEGAWHVLWAGDRSEEQR